MLWVSSTYTALFNNIIVSLANSEGQIILGLLPVKWDSVVLRRTLPRCQMQL